MNWFGKEQKTETPDSATLQIRRALHAKNRSPEILARLARDVGEKNRPPNEEASPVTVAAHVLEAFEEGRRDLPPAVLQRLTEILFHGHWAYDADTDRISPSNRNQPVSMGVSPAAYKPVRIIDGELRIPAFDAGPRLPSLPVKPE